MPHNPKEGQTHPESEQKVANPPAASPAVPAAPVVQNNPAQPAQPTQTLPVDLTAQIQFSAPYLVGGAGFIGVSIYGAVDITFMLEMCMISSVALGVAGVVLLAAVGLMLLAMGMMELYRGNQQHVDNPGALQPATT